MRMIGISGQLRNGKDTVSEILVEKLKVLGLGNWTQIAFADAVKDTVCRVFGVTRDFIEEWKVVDEPPPGWEKSVRECLVWLGDGCRSWKSSVWRDRVAKAPGNKVVSDCRYLNELNMIRESGIVIRVIRPGFQNNEENPSEAELSLWDDTNEGPVGSDAKIPFDYVLYNDGTIQDLREKITAQVVPFCANKLKFFV
jgi:hypothetical protein